ncbi:hypothetical protein [Polaribacter sp. Z022]|uniref:Hpt domain-containing protein n=1 Tax=Polaribacter sp. Z022 TaxID=2927125 RepID=UPI002021090A|nr:hypothetical protein [Polaribacter sp. Z022]MCL7753509.1 hypothetical protein [Polaribacter sp. Z022]
MDFKRFLESKILDLSSIKSFFSDDKELLIELIAVFINDTKPKVKVLENNITNLNFTEVREISHFFKSSFGLMGINCVDDLTILEDLAIKKENPKLITSKLKSVVSLCNKCIVDYESILKNLENHT